MTDRVLTADEVQQIISRRRSIPEDVAELIDSHRLLQQQAKELAEQVVWLKDKLSKVVTHD